MLSARKQDKSFIILEEEKIPRAVVGENRRSAHEFGRPCKWLSTIAYLQLPYTNFQYFHQTNSIEYAVVEKQVVEGIQQGNEVLKEIHKEMSIESVQKLMDDTADAIEYQNVKTLKIIIFLTLLYLTLQIQEIDEILSGKITAEDEEEILKELDELQQQEVINKSYHPEV
jgi:hypothetical protein